MSSSTFYRKYRPQKFSEVIGQKHVVATLTNALKLGKVAQAYLLTGPRGTGKTTLARLFAKAINCSSRNHSTKAHDAFAGAEACGKCPHCLLMAEGRSFDVIEIDAASNTGVDNIRELRETVNLPPSLGSHKVYIIDEVHMLSIGAFNALLKTLEEPPVHVVFILATTALHKVPATILSRCQRFDLTRFPVSGIIEKLKHIAKEEKFKIEDEALHMIALSAEGGMRDAESLLMQIVSLGITPITEEVVIDALGTTKKASATHLIRLIGSSELYPSLAFVREVADSGSDLSLFASLILHSLRDLLLVNTNADAGLALLGELTEEQKTTLTELARLFTPLQIVTMIEHFQVAQVTSKTAVIPELPIEIALVKILSDSNQQLTNSGEQSPLNNRTESSISGQGKKSLPPSLTSDVASKTASKINTEESVSSESKIVPPQSEALFDLSHIQEHWHSILNTAKKLNASISLGLSTARPSEVSGNTIVIAVKYPFHKERLEEKANQLTLEKAFDTILGAQMKLVIVLEAKEASEAKEVDQNPLISEALSMLGGRVVTENS